MPADDPRRLAGARRAALAERVRDLRTERSWTQEDLAHRAGFDRKSINRIENGAYSPSLDRVALLADALGVPVSELVRAMDRPVRA